MDRETESWPAGGQRRPQQGFRTLSASEDAGVVVVGGPWQSRAVAAFTVVVNSEINGDAVIKTSEGSCIVAVECFT